MSIPIWYMDKQKFDLGVGPDPGPLPDDMKLYEAQRSQYGVGAAGHFAKTGSTADEAIRRIEEVAARAADVIIDIAENEQAPIASRLNAAKYIVDLAKSTGATGAGDPLLDMMKMFSKVTPREGSPKGVPGVTQ
jgi:hypothetical protein